MQSYVSLTEISEYAAGIPEEMRGARLFPQLPPEGKAAFCFYPMSKRRSEGHNWYALEFDARKELMIGHGKVGRTFHGRVVQVITGSTGLDEYEWGVTLFGTHPDDLKDCVYEMRFDEASAHYAEFGPFYTGMVGTLDEVLAALGRVRARPSTRSRTSYANLVRSSSPSAVGRTLPSWLGWRTTRSGRGFVLCATALSPSLAGSEEADCRALADEWDLRWVGVPTHEMDDAAYGPTGPIAVPGARRR